ncbi:MAG: sigma-70 family RNA polymerase sigma factor [Acidimicrobiales bacterium]
MPVRFTTVDQLSALAQAAAGGDRAAMAGFLTAAYEPVWRLCAAVVDAQSADDLAQESFVRALGAIAGFRGESSARTWILSIARHTCMDELRSRVRRRDRDSSVMRAQGQPEPPSPDPAEQVALESLVRTLETDQRLAFVLTQVVGLSYEEAAKVCGCPIGTIRSRVARARTTLIASLDATEVPPKRRARSARPEPNDQ